MQLKRGRAEAGRVLVLGVRLGLGILGMGEVGAAQVNWGSDRLATNLTGAGGVGVMDESFTFELGAFEPGFTPTLANRDQWTARWQAAAAAEYHGTAQFFGGSVLVDGMNPAFGSANRGYIWGFDARKPGGTVEWILITHPDWMWPSGAGIATPVEWSVAGASEAVVGEINPPDGGWHMRSATLTLGLDPRGWQEATFGAFASEPLVAGWDADPDGDGATNLLEFALGTGALEAGGGPALALGSEVIGGHAYLTLTVDRVWRPSVDYIPEASSDLVVWSSGADVLEVLEDSENRLTVRDRMPLAEGRRFLRLRVRLAAAD